MLQSLKSFARETVGLEPGLTVTDLEGVPEAAEDMQQIQNDILTCLGALMQSGCSTHRVENTGAMLCSAMGLNDVSIYVLPSLLQVSFNPSSATHPTRTVSKRIAPSLSLSKMEEIDRLISSLAHGRIPKHFLHAVAEEVGQVKELYPAWAQLTTAAVCNGACAAAFFNQGWIGVAVAFCFGIAILGPLTWLSWKFPSLGLIFAPVVAFFAGFVCRGLAAGGVFPHVCIVGLELSCIITLAPGISLAIAALELSSRSIVSGTARFVSAMAVAFLIGLGLTFGEDLAATFDSNVLANVRAGIVPISVPPSLMKCPALSLYWLFLSFPVLSLTFFILLDAPLRRFPVMTVCGSIAFFGAFGLSYTNLSASVQNLITSAAVGAFAAVYSRVTILPSSTVVYAGIMYLVPGALSISTLRSALVGLSSFGLDFLTVSVSISLGLLIASVPKFRDENETFVIFSGGNTLV